VALVELATFTAEVQVGVRAMQALLLWPGGGLDRAFWVASSRWRRISHLTSFSPELGNLMLEPPGVALPASGPV
jgi:hypothetical protein